MRAHRGKQVDWNKPFKTIFSKADFDKLETGENDLVVSITSKPQTNPPPIAKKQQIIVPKIQIVRRITSPKKFARVDPNYIRITDELNLPKLMSYELNEVDHVFLQGQANKFRLNGKPVITPEFLSAAFIELETKAGKDHILPRVKTWMVQFIEKRHKELSALPNVDQLAEVFYNYWKNRREELKFPMLRPLWRPNPQEYSHLLAFKPREKDKRSLRRTSRIAEDEIIQDLEDQFSLCASIAERIKVREELKLKQLQLNFTNFHSECKNVLPASMQDTSFFTAFQAESRTKDKEKLKALQQETEVIRREQIEQEQQQQNELIAQQQTYDQKKSIVNFLSTTVFYAENYGISYDKIFHDRPGTTMSRSPILPMIPSQPAPEIVSAPQHKIDCLQLSLYKDNETIYRVLEEEESNEDSAVEETLPKEDKLRIKAPTNLFEYYTMNMQCYSFGEEDDVDLRDIRRMTSQNFKKFQSVMRS